VSSLRWYETVGCLRPSGSVKSQTQIASPPARGQHVEDLHAMAVGERLEERLELDRLGVGERRAGNRLTARDERENPGHRGILSNIIDSLSEAGILA
jgi:hypothetical protein